jgi:hypothetical protein
MDIEVGFEKMVPPGTSIQAKEVSRRGKSGKDLVVQYHIFVTGVPANSLLKSVDWAVNSDGPTARLEGNSVGKDGMLMCAGRTAEQCGDPNKPDDPIEFTFMPLKGEPTRIAFMSEDLKIGIVVVPDPVEASDRGCTLTAKRMTRAFELAFVSGSGYAPNSDIHYKVFSEMTSDSVVKSDSNGTIRVSVIPFPGKKTDGTARVRSWKRTVALKFLELGTNSSYPTVGCCSRALAQVCARGSPKSGSVSEIAAFPPNAPIPGMHACSILHRRRVLLTVSKRRVPTQPGNLRPPSRQIKQQHLAVLRTFDLQLRLIADGRSITLFERLAIAPLGRGTDDKVPTLRGVAQSRDD